MEYVYFFFFVFLVVVFGLITGTIAHKKGHPFAKWWCHGASMFIVALPKAIMLKPIGEAAGSTEGLRRCPRCAELIQPNASICRFCKSEIIPMPAEEQKQIKLAAQYDAAQETQKAVNVPILAVIFVISILIGLYFMQSTNAKRQSKDGANPITEGTGGVLESDFVINVTGSDGGFFAGTYILVTADGHSKSESIEGKIPARFAGRGSVLSASLQKLNSDSGLLKVQITKNENVISSAQTTEANEVLSVKSN